MSHRLRASDESPQPRVELVELQATVEHLQEQLELHRRRSRRRLLLTAAGVSCALHCVLLLYLAVLYRGEGGGGGPGTQPVTIQLALFPDAGLSSPTSGELNELAPSAEVPLDDLAIPNPLSQQAAQVPTESMAMGASGVPQTLAGSGAGGGGSGGGSGGGDGGGTLGGGAGGTSFFGISSRGTRFAYIVDRSGSMADMSKLEIAKRELVRSIDNLPDYASFMVLFFSDRLLQPDMQDGWMRARKNIIHRFSQWMSQSVTASGGTMPGPAFVAVMALPVRPDVIFFMTDGEIGGFSAEDVAALNQRGKHVVINTIAFGDPSSQELLQRIARDSGGVYRFVPAERW